MDDDEIRFQLGEPPPLPNSSEDFLEMSDISTPREDSNSVRVSELEDVYRKLKKKQLVRSSIRDLFLFLVFFLVFLLITFFMKDIRVSATIQLINI